MSLQDIRSECSEFAGLLQPYVDGELQSEEQLTVAGHLERCQGCRVAVSEQAWVRTTLQTIERERAPQAVRARILQGLDAIDAEIARTAQAADRSSGWRHRLWDRLRDLGRGGLIMVPAGAVAVGLFFVARHGAPPTQDLDALAHAPNIGGALMPGAEVAPTPSRSEPESADADGNIDAELLQSVRSMRPSVGFDIQLPSHVSHPRGESGAIELVSASLDREDPAADPSVRLRYEFRQPGAASGIRFVDRQLRAASFDAPGNPVSVGGRQYRLHRTGAGVPVVYFVVAGIVHAVMSDGEVSSVGAIGAGPALPDGTDADYRPLIGFAERLRAASAAAARPAP